MRSHMRRVNLGEEQDPAIAGAVGMDAESIEAMYRLLAVAKYEDRYVIPTGYTTRDGGGPGPSGCSLEGEGGPGMYDADAFHRPLPDPRQGPHAPQESEHAGMPLRGRVNLLDWDGRSRPDGLFPRPKEQP